MSHAVVAMVYAVIARIGAAGRHSGLRAASAVSMITVHVAAAAGSGYLLLCRIRLKPADGR